MKKYIWLVVLILVMACVFMACSIKNEHTISFDTDGGSEIKNIKATQIDSSPYTEKENYEFLGWYLNKNFNEESKVEFPFKVDKDITLYAKWQKTYTDGLEFVLNKDSNTYSLASYSGQDKKVVIPKTYDGENVTDINVNAFKNNTNIEEIVFPESIQHIDEGILTGCSSLKSLTIPFVGDAIKSLADTNLYPFGYIFGQYNFDGAEATFQTYNTELFNSTTKIYYIPTSLVNVKVLSGEIFKGAFNNCSNIEKVEIPTKAQIVGEYAFDGCKKLNNMILPITLEQIGTYAFGKCEALDSIEIPANVISIGVKAFFGCKSLKSIEVNAFNEKYNSKNNCNAIIESESGKLISGCINTIILDDVKEIGPYAFYDCAFETIDIPSSVISIGEGAFMCCSKLKLVSLPNSITTISDLAFEECEMLESIKLPSELKYLQDGVFSYCKKLVSVQVPNGLIAIGDSVFLECSSLTTINIPLGVESIGIGTFARCTSLESIWLPSSINKLGNYLFEKCTNLTTVQIGNGLKLDGSSLFKECDLLTSITFLSTRANWYSIYQSDDWKNDSNIIQVDCSDGTIYL